MAGDEDYPSLSDVGDCYLTDQEDAIEENVLQGLEDGREEECHWSLSLELENPLILIHDKKISDINSLLPVLEIALKVITEDCGLNLSKVKLEKLVTAKKVTISIDDTIILHGGGDKKLIEERCAAVTSRSLRDGLEHRWLTSHLTLETGGHFGLSVWV